MDTRARLAEQLAGRYELEREVGRGGMGTVFLARDLRLPRRVAIKVLNADQLHAVGTERFHQEVRATSRLSHPNIVPLYDSGTAGELLYFIMQYVQGESLRDRLTRERRLPVTEAVRIVSDALCGLAHAHSEGIVHRDVKPGNILLPAVGPAVVADFGLASAMVGVAASPLTTPGLAVGSPPYMAPEQVERGELDARTDLYGMGCVLFEALAGEPPFTGATAADVLRAHLLDTPPSLRTRRADVHPKLDEAVRVALSKDRADRFETATDMLRALEPAARTGDRYAQPAGVAERAARPGRAKGFSLQFPGWMRTASFWAVPVLGLLLAVAALADRSSDAGPAAPKIVVAPFAGGSTEDAQRAHQTLLGVLRASGMEAAVDGAAAAGPGEPWTALTAAQRRARGRALDATHLITGDLTPSGSGTRLRIEISDVGADRTVAGFVGGGDGETLERAAERLGLQALVALWNENIRTEGGRLGAETTSSDALSSLLAGRRLFYEERNMTAVVDQFDRAIAADSAFAPAYVWRALSEIWWPRFDFTGALRIVEVGITQTPRASPSWREMLTGMRAYLRRDAGAAVQAFASVAANTPELTEAWLMLGESLYHYGSWVGQPRAESMRSFERVFAADAEFAPIHNHMVEMAMHRGDTAATDRYLGMLSGTDESQAIYHVARRLHFGDPSVRRVTLDSLSRSDVRALHGLMGHFAFEARNLPLMDTLAGYFLQGGRASSEVRNGLQYRLAARAGLGDWDGALRAWDGGPPVADVDPWIVSAHLAGFDTGERYATMISAARTRVERAGPEVLGAHPLSVERRALRALMSDVFAHGDSAGVLEWRAFVTRSQGHATPDDPLPAAHLASLEARLALLAADTTRAIAALERALTRVPEPYLQHHPLTALGPQRMALAELLLATRQPARAAPWLRSFSQSNAISDVLYRPRLTELRQAVGASE